MYTSCFLATGALFSSLLTGPTSVAPTAVAPTAVCTDQFVRGPDIPHSATYQPRGLGYLPSRDWLILYSFDSAQRRSILSVIDHSSGRRLKTLALQASEAGGVAISKHLWITHAAGDRHYIRRFSLPKLLNARDGSSLTPDAAFPVAASRYVATHGSTLFVGGTSRLYRYHVSPSGQLKPLPASPDSPAPSDSGASSASWIETPARVAGAIVTSTHFLFSRSAGPEESSLFTIQRRSSGLSSTFLIPSQSQGLTKAGPHVYLAFAAGTRHLKLAPLDQLTARVPQRER
ncbi:hypothetical protein OG394_11610 [Kribbella sp. NBC_01245]|uniref:hypothetical protein n=1 Tax=Kribbella sp. NBC_01245 TaxID=2903578 RepID=UPI002E2DAD25|nr:hypothetical protein [Kribbella sp. NBC_01245]